MRGKFEGLHCKVCEIRKCGKEKVLRIVDIAAIIHAANSILSSAAPPNAKNRLDKINSSFK